MHTCHPFRTFGFCRDHSLDPIWRGGQDRRRARDPRDLGGSKRKVDARSFLCRVGWFAGAVTFAAAVRCDADGLGSGSPMVAKASPWSPRPRPRPLTGAHSGLLYFNDTARARGLADPTIVMGRRRRRRGRAMPSHSLVLSSSRLLVLSSSRPIVLSSQDQMRRRRASTTLCSPSSRS